MGNAFGFLLKCLFLKYELSILSINYYHLILYQYGIYSLTHYYPLFILSLLPVPNAQTIPEMKAGICGIKLGI